MLWKTSLRHEKQNTYFCTRKKYLTQFQKKQHMFTLRKTSTTHTTKHKSLCFFFLTCFNFVFWKNASNILTLSSVKKFLTYISIWLQKNSVTSIYIYILKEPVHLTFIKNNCFFPLFYYVFFILEAAVQKNGCCFSLHQLYWHKKPMQKTPHHFSSHQLLDIRNHAEDKLLFFFTPTSWQKKIILHNCYSLYIIFLGIRKDIVRRHHFFLH